jgi:hypothetical protein
MKVYRQPPHDYLAWTVLAALLVLWVLMASEVIYV